MTDRELLELAAKAAGINAKWYSATGYFMRLGSGCGLTRWEPLTNDGDALRLAVKLNMSVDIDSHENSTYTYAGNVPRVYAMENWCDDKDAATRRAIVRAAAKIGKQP